MTLDPSLAGHDRRAALQKLAVGAATVWVAPTVLSGPVAAQGTQPPPTTERCRSGTVTLARQTLHPDWVVPAHADVGATFAAVHRVCFRFEFQQPGHLGLTDEIEVAPAPPPTPGPPHGPAWGHRRAAPVLSHELCIRTEEEPEQTERWLDGADEFVVVLRRLEDRNGPPVIVRSATVEVCGLAA